MQIISVVIPCYNKQEVLPQLFERLTTAAAAWGVDYQVICVDDGSRDRTWELLEAQHAADARWLCLRLARNFGHQAAVSAGLFHASGDAVVIIDADLQDPPEEVSRLVEKWREGFEAVFAVRKWRKDPVLKRLLAWSFYRFLAFLSPLPIPADAGDFCLLDRKVLDVINALPERSRYLLGLAVLLLGRTRPAAYALLLFAAMLKLYPIVAILAAVRETKRTALIVLGSVGIAFFACILVTLPDVIQVLKVTTHAKFSGFGCQVLADKINDSLHYRGSSAGAWPQAMGTGLAVLLALAACKSGLRMGRPSAAPARARWTPSEPGAWSMWAPSSSEATFPTGSSSWCIALRSCSTGSRTTLSGAGRPLWLC